MERDILNTSRNGKKMTLFDYISPYDIFAKVIDTFYAGSRHNETIRYIRTKKIFN